MSTSHLLFSFGIVRIRLVAALLSAGLAGISTNAGADPGDYDSLVAACSPSVHLNFNETSGPTAADSSGNANTGGYGSNAGWGSSGAGPTLGTAATNTDVASTTDASGEITSRPYLVKIAGSSTLALGHEDFTLEIWFKESSPADLRRDLISYEIGTDLGVILNANDGGGAGAIKYFDGGDATGFTAAGVVSPDEWHLLDVVRSGGQVKIYLDGKQVPFTTGDSLTDHKAFDYNPDDPGSIFVGSGKDMTKAYYNPNVMTGAVDDFAIYKQALSPDVIASHFQAKE